MELSGTQNHWIQRALEDFCGDESQLTGGQTQQQGGDEQDRAGGRSPRAVAVVIAVAAAPVGPVTVVAETALHLGPGADAVSLVTESLVAARLHHCVWRSCETERGAGSEVMED